MIISPDFYDKNRMTVLHERFVLVSGLVQNQDRVVHVQESASTLDRALARCPRNASLTADCSPR